MSFMKIHKPQPTNNHNKSTPFINPKPRLKNKNENKEVQKQSKTKSLSVKTETDTKEAQLQNDSPPAHGNVHALKKGDSLWKLSKLYNVSVSQLQEWNPNTIGRERKLQIGEEIIINKGDEGILLSQEFQKREQLSSAFENFQKTDVYNDLAAPFVENADETLVFFYIEGKHDFQKEIAGTAYNKTSADAVDLKHLIIFYGLDVTYAEMVDGNIETTPGDWSYDQAFLGGVFAHEMIHANLDRHIESGKVNIENLEKMYPGITIVKNRIGLGEKGQHEYMALHLRGLIKEATKQSDTARGAELRKDEWYEAISWYGLTETDAWKELKKNSPEKFKYIHSIFISIDIDGKAKPLK